MPFTHTYTNSKSVQYYTKNVCVCGEKRAKGRFVTFGETADYNFCPKTIYL